METAAGYDPAVWAQAAGEIGLQGLVVPERHGGSGATAVELGVVFEEMGAALHGGPFLASVGLATTALLEIGDGEAAAQYLPGLAAGTTIAALAWAGREPAASTLTARRTDGGWAVSGMAGIVVDGATAGLVLVGAHTDAGPSLFAVTAEGAGLTRTPLITLDLTRKLAELRFDEVPARLVGSEGGAGPALRRTADTGRAVPGRRAARRRRQGAGDRGGVRRHADAVRPGHRLVPGDQAPVRGHARRRRVGPVGRAARAVDRGARPGRAAGLGGARPGGRLRRLPAGRRAQHPDPRRDRVHLGALRAPVPQAREEQPAAARLPGVPPRPARRAARRSRTARGDPRHGRP